MLRRNLSGFRIALLISTCALFFTACSSDLNTGGSNSNAVKKEVSYPSSTTTSNASMANSSTAAAPSATVASDEEGASGERYAKIEENPFLETSRAPLSTFSIDVDTASYANVRRYVNGGSLPPKDAVRLEELVNYFEYDYPQPIGNVPFSVNTEMATCPWNKQHKIVSIGLQGRKVSLDNVPPSNLVFLIDTSGSMNEPDKLPLLKESFRVLVNQLSTLR